MRALIIHSPEPYVARLAEAVGRGLERKGGQVEVTSTAAGGATITVAGYDLICVGAAIKGRFGGSVSPEIDAALKRCTRLNGKQGAAFVSPKLLGTTRSLRALMGLLEHQGVQVRDFEAPSGVDQALRFGERLAF
ncbi:MAG TPA: hypothetical protein VFK80_01830 [Limnochordia bacterium]|nr:hypothetical protein [Limnochordia bacterium]